MGRLEVGGLGCNLEEVWWLERFGREGDWSKVSEQLVIDFQALLILSSFMLWVMTFNLMSVQHLMKKKKVKINWIACVFKSETQFAK